MTPSQAAAIMQLSVKTITRYAKTGQLAVACRTLGERGHHRYFRAQCEAYRRGEPLTAEQVQDLRDQLSRQVRQP